MDLANHTPFASFTFRSLDLDDQEFQVVVLKGTFELGHTGNPVQAKTQDPVRLSPEPFSEDKPESLRYADDLAPFKPRADVLLTATSYAPRGLPAREWPARVSVGRVTKELHLTGPRAWVHTRLFGWILSEPVEAVSVPIRYENAYGGVATHPSADEFYPHNSVGKGFVYLPRADKAQQILAPVILRPGAALKKPGKPYPVEGLSPIPPSWQPRLAKSGTLDAEWLKTRHPYLPRDFSFDFYNCAHPDLVYPGYLQGGEVVQLDQLCASHEQWRFRLPQLLVGVSTTDLAGHRHGKLASLDTVHIDTEQMKLWLVWRAILPFAPDDLGRVDLAMTESAPGLVARAAALRTRPAP